MNYYESLLTYVLSLKEATGWGERKPGSEVSDHLPSNYVRTYAKASKDFLGKTSNYVRKYVM